MDALPFANEHHTMSDARLLSTRSYASRNKSGARHRTCWSGEARPGPFDGEHLQRTRHPQCLQSGALRCGAMSLRNFGARFNRVSAKQENPTQGLREAARVIHVNQKSMTHAVSMLACFWIHGGM